MFPILSLILDNEMPVIVTLEYSEVILIQTEISFFKDNQKLPKMLKVLYNTTGPSKVGYSDLKVL